MNLTAILALCAATLALNLHATPAQAADPPPAFALEIGNAPPWPLADAMPTAALPNPTPTPAPPVVVVQAPPPSESTMMAKVYMWGGILTAAITVFAAAAGFALQKVLGLIPEFAKVLQAVSDLRGRADRQAQKTGGLQNQLTNVAIAAGVPSPPPEPPTTSPIVPAILALLMPATLLFSGCATASSPQEAAERRALARQAASTALRLTEAGATAYLESREGFRK